jgi:hypothetical protein
MDGYSSEEFEAAQAVNADELQRDILTQMEFFLKAGSDAPKELIFHRELQISRL